MSNMDKANGRSAESDSKTDSRTSADGAVHVSLTYDHLDIATAIAKVRDPSAGAVVMFAGTTRDTFDGRPVASLTYESYIPLALTSLLRLAEAIRAKHDLVRVSFVHRLGEVPVGEESVLICVSAPHRTAAWRGGEEALEEVKKSAEIWKLERFVGESGGYWRSNHDGASGVWVDDTERDKDDRNA